MFLMCTCGEHLGNLRSTTKETTTTSIDRTRTRTRTSFSVGEMKVKKRRRRLKFDDAPDALWDSGHRLLFHNFFERCIKPCQHDEYFLVLTFLKQNVQNYSKFVLGQMAKSECSSRLIFLPWRSSQDLTNKFISSIVIWIVWNPRSLHLRKSVFKFFHAAWTFNGFSFVVHRFPAL